MEPEGIIGLLQTSVVLAVMASGAICDWRTRHVPDAHWLILCVIGIPLAAAGIGIGKDPLAGALYAAGETASTFRKVFPYILVGVGIGSLVHNWIPQEVIEPVLGDGNPFAVILATVAGAPIYADVFGVIPIAESLLAKGAALGTVLSFMMSVTVLSIPSLIMLARVVKPKLLGVFVGICLIGIVACGYAFNVLQPIL